MQAYGDNVQFSTNGTIHGPNYQVINAAGKKIAFDSSNLLIQPNEDDFVGKTSGVLYTLDQINALLVKINSPVKKSAPARSRRAAETTGTSSSRGSTALTKIKEQIAIQKYEYYKTNRTILPSTIREHSEEITRMMESGIPVETAFAEATKLCVEN